MSVSFFLLPSCNFFCFVSNTVILEYECTEAHNGSVVPFLYFFCSRYACKKKTYTTFWKMWSDNEPLIDCLGKMNLMEIWWKKSWSCSWGFCKVFVFCFFFPFCCSSFPKLLVHLDRKKLLFPLMGRVLNFFIPVEGMWDVAHCSRI